MAVTGESLHICSSSQVRLLLGLPLLRLSGISPQCEWPAAVIRSCSITITHVCAHQDYHMRLYTSGVLSSSYQTRYQDGTGTTLPLVAGDMNHHTSRIVHQLQHNGRGHT